MLFSAGFDSFKCTQCEKECTNVVPTSIIPMGLCCLVAGTAWTRILRGAIWDHWVCNLIGFAIALLVLWAVYETIERITNRAIRSGRCPFCKGTLVSTGHGFYDGCIPNPWEIVTYILTIVGSFLAYWLYYHLYQNIG